MLHTREDQHKPMVSTRLVLRYSLSAADLEVRGPTKRQEVYYALDIKDIHLKGDEGT